MAIYVVITNTSATSINQNGFTISGHEVKHIVFAGNFEFIQNSSGRLILVDFGSAGGQYMPYTAETSPHPGRGLIPQLANTDNADALLWEIYGTLDDATRSDVTATINNR